MASNNDVSLVKDWQTTREARAYMNALYKRKKRVQFGLLEHPTIVSPLLKKAPIHTCKMFLYGKSGVGKTSTVMKLSGRPVPLVHHETLGIQTTTLYWPIKRSEETIELLQVELWDTGERALRKYEHILSSCLSSTNMVAFFFSYSDRSSWEELPDILAQASTKIQSHLKVVLGTKLDTPTRHVTAEEVEQFEHTHQIRVIPISNISEEGEGSSSTTRGDLHDICTPLNTLAELVLNHELKQSSVYSGNNGSGGLMSLQQSVRKIAIDDNIEISDV